MAFRAPQRLGEQDLMDLLSLVGPLAIAIGPLGAARARPPGMLLELRKLAEEIVKKLDLPKTLQAFVGGGFARGFGRQKGKGLNIEDALELAGVKPDVDLIFGIPKEALKELQKRFAKQGIIPALREGALSVSPADFARMLSTDVRLQGFVRKAGEARRLHGLELSTGHPVDLFADLLENIGTKGMTGFDPVIPLPLRLK